MSGGARRTIGLGTAATLVLLLTAFVSPASAVVVACGQTITQNTVLTADVGPCPNNGIIVGADNITLDLGGHHVFGTPNPGDGAGILIQQRTGVRVQNGTVRNFDAGVVAIGGGGHTITGLRVTDNVGTSSTNYGDGILLLGADDTTVSRNQVTRNGPFSGISISADDVTNPDVVNRAERNVIDGNQVVLNAAPLSNGEVETIGIRVEGGNRFNTISNNQVSQNALDGIQLFLGATDNIIRRNAVNQNGFDPNARRRGSGIIVGPGSIRNLVEQNQMFGNAGNGLLVQGGSSVVIPANRFLFNRAFGNATGGQANTFDIRDTTGPNPCDNNEYHGNQAGTFSPPCVLAP